MFDSVKKVRNLNLIKLSKKHVGTGVEESGFKIADHYVNARKELPNSYKKDFFPRLKEINLKLDQGNELSELEKNFLRYYTFSSYFDSDFLNLNSQFRVLTTSSVNPEIQSLIPGYEENGEQEKLRYVGEMKSFLKQDKIQRDKLLPYIEDFTTLPNKHLDQIDKFINSHLPFMTKIIFSIRNRGGNFTLKEAECMFRGESWRYVAGVLKNVRNNPGKGIVDNYERFNNVEFTISFTFLRYFLEHSIIVTKLNFEDNVFLLTNSSSFMNLNIRLIDSINDDELNEFIQIKVEEESLDEDDGFEKAGLSSILETPIQQGYNHEVYLNLSEEKLREKEKLLKENEIYLEKRRRELEQDRKKLINDEVKLKQDRSRLSDEV